MCEKHTDVLIFYTAICAGASQISPDGRLEIAFANFESPRRVKRSRMESNMKQAYPTFIIDSKDGSEHMFLVNIPDMEILTEGDNLVNAIEMARDAIGLAGISMEDNDEEIPLPSSPEAALDKVSEDTEVVDFSKGILTYVDVDFSEYRKKVDTRTVRRNVALPSWLNYEADKAGINVSRVLQEALMSKLKLERRL